MPIRAPRRKRDPRVRQHTRGIRPIDLSEAQLASSETARRINRDIVLELIRASQPLSRADLARRSGLQRSTVSQIVEQLHSGEVGAGGSVASPPRGRRPTLLVLERRSCGDRGRSASEAGDGRNRRFEWAAAGSIDRADHIRSCDVDAVDHRLHPAHAARPFHASPSRGSGLRCRAASIRRRSG